TESLNIVMAASEAVPYAKTGGLADVIGVLPIELIKLGHRVTVILPGHRSVLASTLSRRVVTKITVPTADRSIDVALEEELVPVAEGTPPLRLLVVRCDACFDRPGLYQDEHGDYPDNLERFIIFCRAVLEGLAYVARRWGEPAHLLHLHDWQAALCAVYLKVGPGVGKSVSAVKTLLTIHNIGYQGLFPGEQFSATGLHPTVFAPSGLEFYGSVNCLKGGIVFADAVSTVSPTYAKEILTQEFGCGLEGVLTARAAPVQGITNGIDVDVWNPETDRYLPARYHAADLSGKEACKQAIQRELGLPVRDVPLLAAIGRLTSQKGFDLLLDIIPELARLDVQVALLGTGDRHLEQQFLNARAAHPDRVAVHIGFDDALAHRIEAGADMVVMPSRYEPCGLTQLYSLRYGTIPIVRKTGGLADTVVPFKPSTAQAKRATGFHVGEASPDALLTTILLALSVYEDREAWRSMISAGMSSEMSWTQAASRYIELYRSIIKTKP
ncbi:MAG: glycogen synthase GlgA, partial [Nitrospira sp.]|nr:glycogen synthase GlgA [Nitrospira sp.]